MKAIVLKDIDSNVEQLELVDMSQPLIKSSTDVLIRTSFASINPVDYKLANNHFSSWTYPYIIGLDFAGVVVDVGIDCKTFKVGDLVAAHGDLTYGGALAEYVIHPEHVLFKLPDDYNLSKAAALPCAGLTAYQALVRKMNIKSAKTIFIQGGSGGVGSFAILIAKSLGLNVIATCSSKNIAYVKNLGADIVLDYNTSDVYAKIKELYPKGVDYILETTNKDNLQRDLSILAFNGQIASIVGVLDTTSIMEFTTGFGFHEVALGGAYLSAHHYSQCDLSKMGYELVSLLGDRCPEIKIYQLSDYKQAFLDLQANKYAGKIVLSLYDNIVS